MDFKIYYLSFVSWFGSAKKRLKRNLQSKKQAQDSHLKGRIKELEKSTHTVLKELSEVKLKLSQKVDAQVFKHVAQIIDPIESHARKLHGQIKEQKPEESIAGQKFEKARKLNEKAKLWVKMSKSLADSDQVIKAVIEHTLLEIHRQIDQDLQILNSYHEHYFDDQGCTPDEKEHFLKMVFDELAPYMVALDALKECRVEGDLQDLKEWRHQINLRRAYLFDSALHLIESHRGEGNGKIFGETASRETVALSVKIEALINGLNEVKKSLMENEVSSGAIRQQLIDFEHEAHLLNENLRLTTDQFEKLQDAFSLLEEIQEII